MTAIVTHSEGLPNTDELDLMLADLSFSPVADEIIGEMPIEPENEDDVALVIASEEATAASLDITDESALTTEEIAAEVMADLPPELAALPEVEPAPAVEAAPAPVAQTTLEDLDSLLAFEVVPSDDATMTEDDVRALDVALSKAEAYESQAEESTLTMGEEAIEAAPAAVTTAKKAKAAKAPKAPAAPKVAKDITLLDAAHFALTVGIEADADAKTALVDKRPKQVKIAEKFDNVIASLAAGRAPSVYVTTCFATLDARKEVLGSDLVAALQAADYTVGTARSQAGQIMVLFDLLGVGERVGQKLTLRPDSAFAAKLRALPAA